MHFKVIGAQCLAEAVIDPDSIRCDASTTIKAQPMTKFDPRDSCMLRGSLVFVWLATALVSVIELWGQSAQLLNAGGVHDPLAIKILVSGGAGIDALLGLLFWFTPGRRTYLSALAMMVVMTLVATTINPTLWLNPLGPLAKNVPLAALLLVLARAQP